MTGGHGQEMPIFKHLLAMTACVKRYDNARIIAQKRDFVKITPQAWNCSEGLAGVLRGTSRRRTKRA